MSVSSHAVCAQISPLPPTTAEGTRRRPLSETATRSRKLGGAQTHHHRRDRGWMTLRVYARVASRLSTTSAQLSGTHANARTHGHWGVPSFLPVAQGYHNNTPPDCWHEPLSSTTWHTQGHAGTNARALNCTQSLDQHPPLMAATIFNSPSLLSSSLLRCMTLLTMRYSFRLSCSRSRAVRFGFFLLPQRVPKINSYSNFGFAVLYCLVRQASGIQARLHLRVLFPLLCRRGRWSCWCLGWISPSLFSLSVCFFSLSLSLSLPLGGGWQPRFWGGDGSQTGGVTWSKSVGGRLLSQDADSVRPPCCWPLLTLQSPSCKHCLLHKSAG